MINKVVGYAGFQSYGDLPYAAIKPGKERQKPNEIWKQIARPQDIPSHLDNFHYLKTNYRKDYLENTQPQHYQEAFRRTVSGGFDANGTQSAPEKSKEEISSNLNLQSSDSLDIAKQNFLKTGVEHWKTTYKQQVDDVTGSASDKLSPVGDLGTGSLNVTALNTRQADGSVQLYSNLNLSNQLSAKNQQLLVGNSSRRSQSASQATQVLEQAKNKAYINRCPMGVSDYKFHYGQKIGHAPKPHIMDEFSTGQPRIYHPLKVGTPQLVEHIPGYQGFVPAARTIGRAFEHGKGAQTRTTFLKNNLIQNYKVQIPGYAGHVTKSGIVDEEKLRSSCFRTNELLRKQ